MILYFENSRSVKRKIGQPKDLEEALHIINKFCDDRGFPIYYTRMWDEDGVKNIDVGSHTEFFILEDTNESGIGVD